MNGVRSVPLALLRVRATLAAHAGLSATLAGDAWLRLPPWFKTAVLKHAGLDARRYCMPLETFEPAELSSLRRVCDDAMSCVADFRRAVVDIKRGAHPT
jgi:hypothetical protein